MRLAAVTVFACVTLSSLATADARPRSRAPQLSPDCNVIMSCQMPHTDAGAPSGAGWLGAPSTEASSPREARAARRAERRAARAAARDARRQARAGFRGAMAYAPATGISLDTPPAASAGEGRREPARAATSMKGIVPGLAAKVAEIQASCPGAHVISTVRHTRIRGTRRLSLHASGEAVDMRGNPSCVYAKLQGWPGGYSTDYGRAKHIHISLSSSGREMGLRFAHGGGHKSHRHRRVALR